VNRQDKQKGTQTGSRAAAIDIPRAPHAPGAGGGRQAVPRVAPRAVNSHRGTSRPLAAALHAPAVQNVAAREAEGRVGEVLARVALDVDAARGALRHATLARQHAQLDAPILRRLQHGADRDGAGAALRAARPTAGCRVRTAAAAAAAAAADTVAVWAAAVACEGLCV